MNNNINFDHKFCNNQYPYQNKSNKFIYGTFKIGILFKNLFLNLFRYSVLVERIDIISML